MTTEPFESPAAGPLGAAEGARGASPGALLRQAREHRGVRIEVLASTLKVSPRKLELLEADRFSELPDATFIKTLSLAVCRALKEDSAPVMAAFSSLELSTDPFKAVGKGLNAPMHTPAARLPLLSEWTALTEMKGRSVAIGLSLLSILGLAIGWWSQLPQDQPTPATSPLAAHPISAVSPPVAPLSASPASASPGPLASTPPASAGMAPAVSDVTSSTAALSASTPMTSVPPAPAALRAPSAAEVEVSASEASWVEATDTAGRVVWSGTLRPGERVSLPSTRPLQVVIGNAGATRVVVDGLPFDLTPAVRGNVARLQLP